MDVDELLNSRNKYRIISFLKTKEAKELLIKKDNFFQHASFYLRGEYLKYLFDNYGMQLLKETTSDNLKSFLTAMINSEDKNLFLKKDDFLIMILQILNPHHLLKIENNKEVVYYLLNNIKFQEYLNKQSRTAILKNLHYNDLIKVLSQTNINDYDLYDLLLHPDIFEWVIKNKRISLKELSFDQLNELLKKGYQFPQHLIDNKEFINYISTEHNVLKTREVLLNLSKEHDISLLEKRRKQFYEEQFSQIKNNMLKKYQDFYNELFSEDTDFTPDYFHIIYDTYFKDEKYLTKNDPHFMAIIYCNPKRTIEEKKKIFKEELIEISSRVLTNMIIDYHFEEYYSNVLVDIKELLNFSNKGGKELPKDKFNLYYSILTMDNITDTNEKLKIHEELKNHNMIEMFYDDMSEQRKIMNEMISNYVLTKESIKEHLDKEKSEKLGVDVYSFNGQDFFAVVKSDSEEPHKNARPNAFGHSFSLIGAHGIGTFSKSRANYIYDGLKPEQIVHVFPYDSFTLYDRNAQSSNSVRVLMTPKELIDSSADYNEMLILEKGTSPSEMDEFLPELRKIAVYCYNRINEETLERAKNENIGIMLINTKEYRFGTSETVRDIPFYEYEYYSGDNLETVEYRRKEFTKL